MDLEKPIREVGIDVPQTEIVKNTVANPKQSKEYKKSGNKSSRTIFTSNNNNSNNSQTHNNRFIKSNNANNMHSPITKSLTLQPSYKNRRHKSEGADADEFPWGSKKRRSKTPPASSYATLSKTLERSLCKGSSKRSFGHELSAIIQSWGK